MSKHHDGGSTMLAYLALAMSMALVGTGMTANKFIAGNVPVFLAGELRMVIASIAILPLVFVVEGALPRLDRRTHITIFMQSLFGTVLFNTFVLLGVDMTTAAAGGIVLASTPAVIAIFSWMMGDRLGRVAWIGVLLTIGGVLIVNVLGTESSDDARRPILGAILIFAAVVCESLYTILGRPIARQGTPLGNSAWFAMYGMLTLLPLALPDVIRTDFKSIPGSAWIALIYMGTVVLIAPLFLWYVGLRTVPTSQAGAFTGAIPITAVISAWLVLDEHITWAHILGIVTIVVGIALVARTTPTAAALTGD